MQKLKRRKGFLKVTGGKVWYEIVGERDETPLLAIHGGPGFPHHTLIPVEQLANERPVIFYDQLGCGYSDRPKDKSLWKKERFLEELQTVVKRLGLKKYHILGHSWGTMLTIEYSLMQPNSLAKIILSSPFLSTKRWITDTNRLRRNLPIKVQQILDKYEKMESIDSKEYKEAEEEFYKRYLCRVRPLPKLFLKNIKEGNMDVYKTMWGNSEFYCSGNLKGTDLTPRLYELKNKTLLICGKYDMATPGTTRYYASLIPNSKVSILSNSSHSPALEETNKYIKVVREFLD